MITVAVVLLPNKAKKHIVNIRLTQDRKSKYVSLSYKVEPAMFKSDALHNWVHGRHPDAVFINQAIEKKRKQALELIGSTDDISLIAKSLKGEFKPAADGSFFQAVTDRANFHYANDSPGSYYKYKGVRLQIEKAWGRDYAPSQITVKLVEQFRLYRKKCGLQDNTIRKEISFLATAFRTVTEISNPFEKVKIVPIPTTKEKLTPEEIIKIEKLVLFGFADLAKDMGLFSFYAQGMRFENVCLIPKDCLKNGLVIYQMNKGKKHRQIQAHKRLEELVIKYQNSAGPFLFPILKKEPGSVWDKRDLIGSANSEINRALKIVAAAAGIDKTLTFHLFRHTAAYLALKKGVTYAELKDILGHSNYSTTQGYLDSLSDDSLNEAMSKLYGE